MFKKVSFQSRLDVLNSKILNGIPNLNVDYVVCDIKESSKMNKNAFLSLSQGLAAVKGLIKSVDDYQNDRNNEINDVSISDLRLIEQFITLLEQNVNGAIEIERRLRLEIKNNNEN